MCLYVKCLVIYTNVGTVLVKIKDMCVFLQMISGKTVRLIADSCQHLEKLTLTRFEELYDDVIHVIKKLGQQLTALVLDGTNLTDVAYSNLKNCAR